VNISIRTNNVPRDIISEYELTKKEQAEFDYLDWEAMKRGEDSHSFVRYRGELCSLSDFVRIVPRSNCVGWEHGVDEDSPLLKWDGIRTDSFFSGLVIRWAKNDWNGQPDFERVVIGLVTC